MALKVYQLGIINYSHAYAFQKEIFSKVLSGKIDHGLIICSHNPVITAGRSVCPANREISESELRSKGIEFFRTERGGDLTYHGEGQITAYPIFNLKSLRKDIHLFLRYLEEVIISFLGDCQIKGERKSGFTGVWIDDKKIASIGVAVKRWVTYHGVSINIKRNDLAGYTFFKPCGLEVKMTSLEDELGRNISIGGIAPQLANNFQRTLAGYYN
jgi:lipoate-protein ligase B